MKRSVTYLLLAISVASIAGCSTVEKAKPRPRPAEVDASFREDVPQIMRGTVASETAVLGYEQPGTRGYQPVIARGYGLVVGLHATGSRDIPPQIRQHMIQEAARRGIGSGKYGPEIDALTPEALLDSPDTAVVIVEAVIPQGSVEGTKFDVRVIADPRSGTTSLEGGRLYSTLLRPGLPTTGSAQAGELAVARGPVFINPFAEPGAIGKDSINRTSGRVLNGGTVLKRMPLKLRLLAPSHTKASTIQNAINARFPQEPGQRDDTARGESGESLEITVPPSYKDRTDEFIELLRHITIRRGNPDAVAMSIRRLVVATPLVAEAASLRWEAIGPRSIPIIRELYDHPEELPRLAALRAGAKLNDPLVIPQLVAMSESASADGRHQAVALLAEMGMNPQIDQTLRALLNDDDIELRLNAYEALVERGDPYMSRHNVGGKFILDVVESDKPLIYITQVGEPRIVLFGQAMEVNRPLTVTAWSNRFMVRGDADDSQVEVYFRDPDAEQGLILRAEPRLEEFVKFLGHTTSVERPDPGLGLSYAETVGALHQIWSQKYINADFKAEQDRILAAILRQQQGPGPTERPEFTEPETDEQDSSETLGSGEPAQPAEEDAEPSLGASPGGKRSE